MTESGEKTKKIAGIVKMSQRAVQLYIKQHMPDEIDTPWSEFIPRREVRHNKREERKVALTEIIDSDCTLTQTQMNDSLPDDLKCSRKTISKALKGLNLTRKRLRCIPQERNTPATINLRRIYANSIAAKPDCLLYFLDETGFNLHTGPRYGYSKAGQSATVTRPGNRGQNLSVLCCIGLGGVLHWESVHGAYNSQLLCDFLDRLCPLLPKNGYLIMDNASFHKSDSVRKIMTNNGVKNKYLSPYSPQLNPIEEFFSALKAEQARIRPRPKTKEQLEITIKQSFDNIESLDLSGFYSHMRKFIRLAREGIPFDN